MGVAPTVLFTVNAVVSVSNFRSNLFENKRKENQFSYENVTTNFPLSESMFYVTTATVNCALIM